MNYSIKIVIPFLLALFPLVTFSDTTDNFNSYKASCMEDVKKDAVKTSNPDAYTAYYNKLCDCTADKFKDIDPNIKTSDEDLATIKSVYGLCIGRAWMSEAVKKVKEPLTEENMTTTCYEEGTLIFKSQTPKDAEIQKKLCVCAAGKIIALDKNKLADDDALQDLYIECAKLQAPY